MSYRHGTAGTSNEFPGGHDGGEPGVEGDGGGDLEEIAVVNKPDLAGLPEEGVFAFEGGTRDTVDLNVERFFHDTRGFVLFEAIGADLPGTIGDDEYLETLAGIGVLKGDSLLAFVFVIGLRLERVGIEDRKTVVFRAIFFGSFRRRARRSDGADNLRVIRDHVRR